VRSTVIGRSELRGVERDPADASSLKINLVDSWMSSAHVQLKYLMGRWVIEDLDSKNGTRLNGALVKRAPLSDGDILEMGHSFFVFRSEMQLGPHPTAISSSSELDPVFPGQPTLVSALASQLAELGPIARSLVSVLIRGETGTGKELMARGVHQLSARPGAFVAVNCAAIPETLLEAELFGYQKGAFSGAGHGHVGLIRSADRGTLFLDEIGDLPSHSQVSLLRVLQEHQVVPLGETRPVPVDVRLCTATHRDIEHLLATQQIREDFFGRVAGFTVHLPPLRQRREDLGLIIASLLRRLVPHDPQKVIFERRAARVLFLYDWPRNIRELEKYLEAAVALAEEGTIDFQHLPAAVRAAGSRPSGAEAPAEAAASSPKRQPEREKLIELLLQHHGNISAVARTLGTSRIQVRRWLAHQLIDPSRYRKPQPPR
jgi:transcriptional regulator with PAS, ATPase and Fis domain